MIVPTYSESDEILIETLDCLVKQTLPASRIAVVLAFEERDAAGAGARRAPQPALRPSASASGW